MMINKDVYDSIDLPERDDYKYIEYSNGDEFWDLRIRYNPFEMNVSIFLGFFQNETYVRRVEDTDHLANLVWYLVGEKLSFRDKKN